MRCRMVGRWPVPKTAAAVANSGAATRVVAVAAKWGGGGRGGGGGGGEAPRRRGAATRVVAVAAKWRAWAMRAARTLRTAQMRPGMGWVGVGAAGAVRVTDRW